MCLTVETQKEKKNRAVCLHSQLFTTHEARVGTAAAAN
jgi:hypothetical protein